MPLWAHVLAYLAGSMVGWVIFRYTKDLAGKLPYWIVIVVYEGPVLGDSLLGEKREQHLFYIAAEHGPLTGAEVRGGLASAKRFFTKKGAQAAAAELALTRDLEIDEMQRSYLSRNSFRFAEIRIVRTSGL